MKKYLRLGEGYGLSNIKRYILYALLISIGVAWLPDNKAQAQTTHVKNFSMPEGGLRIGDSIPDITLKKIFNYTNVYDISENISLRKFSKDKLVILDFGGLYCRPCIESAEHLNALTSRFNGKFLVLPVVAGPVDQVIKLAQRHNWYMPYVAEEPILAAAFPHWYIPHLVWIYQGKLRAVTNAADATEININSMLQGKKMAITEKKDVMALPQTPLDQLASQQGVPIQFQSALTGHIVGLGGREMHIDDSYIQFNYDNVSILTLYLNALKILPNHLVIEVADSVALKNNRKDTSALFCYQLRIPKTLRATQIRNKIISDLNAWFTFNGRFEYRTLPCYAIDEDTNTTVPQKTSDSLNIKDFVYSLNNPFDQDPGSIRFVDESKSTVYVPRLNTDSLSRDIPALQKALKPYGLRVNAAQRKMHVFVISDCQTLDTDLPTHLIKP